MDVDTFNLKQLSKRLATKPDENRLVLRIMNEAIEHFLTGSDGTTTAVELELVACAFRAQHRVQEAEVMEAAAAQLLRRVRNG